MGLLTNDYYEAVKDYLHLNIHSFVNNYRCGKVNKNGTRKIILHEIGKQCVAPTHKRYWRKPKPKYKRKIGFLYWTRDMTQTRMRHLIKNKGNFIYNYKLKKYEHMSETPMWYNFKEIQDIKK